MGDAGHLGSEATPACPDPSGAGAGAGETVEGNDEPLAPLHTAEQAFRVLVKSHGGLTVDGRRIGGGLPRRRISLLELRELLLSDQVPAATRDAVWRVLVCRARHLRAAWAVAAVGVALPGLHGAARRLSGGQRPEATGDWDAELLAGFLSALHTVDVDEDGLCGRLIAAAYNGARRARTADRTARRPHRARPHHTAPPVPWGHPDLVLARAVAAGVLSAAEAELISATRVGGQALADAAAVAGASPETVRKRRWRAERRLVAALRDGPLSAPPPASRTGGTGCDR